IHEGFNARWERPVSDKGEAPRFWRAEIPLALNRQTVGRLEVCGTRDDQSVCQQLIVLDKIVEALELAIAAAAAAKELLHPTDTPIPRALIETTDNLQLEKV